MICVPVDLEKSLNIVMEPKIGIYRHYKGNEYLVIGVGKQSETLEDYVIYKALYGDQNLWVRPLYMFLEYVEVNEKTIPRFEWLREIENR